MVCGRAFLKLAASVDPVKRVATISSDGFAHYAMVALATRTQVMMGLPMKHPPFAPILLAVLGAACASASHIGPMRPARDFAYARAHDSIVVAVSARNRSDRDVERALETAVTRAAAEEGCTKGELQLRGDSDARLATDALAYLGAPHRIAVASCQERPATLRTADLRTLQWIVGTWRGSGDGQAPFYERYRFVDDSTLLVESFKDSTVAQVTESSRYELRGGRFANAAPANGAQWVAVRLTNGAVTFAPVRRARNRFIWRPVSADEWSAELAWPPTDASGAGARTRTYRMVRWTPP